MADLEGALARIPGLAGYLAQNQYNQNQTLGQLQQVGGVLSLANSLRDREQEAQFRQGMAQIQTLPEDQRQSAMVDLAAKFSSPKDVLARQQSSLDRQAQIAAVKEAALARIQNSKDNAQMLHEVRLQNAKTAEDRAGEIRRHNAVIELLTKQMNSLRQEKYEGAQQQQLGTDLGALNEVNANLDRLAKVATDVRDHPGLAGITGVTGKFPDVPGSDAANARAKLATLQSQVGLTVLQSLRNASKTGGALGQVSDYENKILQNNIDALGTAQSEESYKEALNNIIEYTEKAKGRLKYAFDKKYEGRKVAKDLEIPDQPPSTQNVIKSKSKSGRPIKSTDGGKTWVYDEND